MGGFFSSIGQLFGKGGRKAQGFGGTKPFKSLKDIEEGKLFAKTLRERVAGRGVGFDPEVISGATAPFAVARRRALKETTIPTISAQASARGVGRSTIPVNRIALESSRAEQDISERVAQLSVLDQQQRRNEINDAVARLGGFTRDEAAQRGKRAGFEFREFSRLEEARDLREQRKVQGAGRALSLAATVAAPFLPGGAGLTGLSKIAASAGNVIQGNTGNVTKEQLQALVNRA